jgi:hypothetical protein
MFMQTPQGEVEIVPLNIETYKMLMEALPERQKTLTERAERERRSLGNLIDEEVGNLRTELDMARAESNGLRVQITELNKAFDAMPSLPLPTQEAK